MLHAGAAICEGDRDLGVGGLSNMVEAVEPAGGRGFRVAAGVGGVVPSTICSRRGESARESSFCVSYFPQRATLAW
jgi:hypothetical protein